MVTLHPVGLPHGPKPRAIEKWLDGKVGAIHNEVAVMADFANPARVSQFALGLSRPDYMDMWSGYTTEPRFTWRADRLDEIRRAAEGLADARDTLTPPRAD
jgi:homogentisate 1,2-dioxygenase